MASFYEITRAAQRTITITIRGIKVQVTENLMRDPTPEINARKRLREQVQSFKDAMRKAQEADARAAEDGEAGTTHEDAAAQFTGQMMQLEAMIENDDRLHLIQTVCVRVAEWDITDDAKKPKPLPLDANTLYPLPIPTELFKELLAAMDREPIVGEASASH